MDTKTPLIPQKQHPERSRPKKQERAADVSLPPLTPFPNHRPRAKTSWNSSPPKSHPLGFQDSLKRRPYKVLQIGATPLMHACQQGDRTRVLKLLKEQSETIGYRDRTLRSALHYCMDAGTGGAVASAAPELVNHPDSEGHTPLHLAVIAGDTQLVAVLLANGADVNAKDFEGHSVLHWATVCGEAECVRLVLAAGARPSTPDLRGGSPLHYAAQCCGAAVTAELSVPKKVGLKVLQTLLEFGSDVNAKDEDGRQPILWAASAGSVEAVLALTRAGGSAAAGASDKDGLTALHCAASRGHARCVEALVNLCGSQPDHVDDNGCSALHYAATLGHADATALLLRLGADPNRQDRKGRTPALCAAAKGQLETLKILSIHGGSLHARTIRGTGIAHEAVASGCVELVKWLGKKRKALLDTVTQDGKTPLHVAALHGYLDVCKVLLDNGVKINVILKTSKGSSMTALDAALYRGNRDCAKLIQMHGGSTAQHLRSHKTAPSKVFAAKLRVKCPDSSTESDSSPRRKSHRHRDPDLYYEERWIERRTRRRKGNSRKLSRRDSRSFSEEELRHSKTQFKKDQQRRALSESARYNNENETDDDSSPSRKQYTRPKRSKHEYSESWTESETEDDILSSSRKSTKETKGENFQESSLSDDSLEVVIVKSIEKKSEKLISGRKSKTPKESYEDKKIIKSRKSCKKHKTKDETEKKKKTKTVEIDESSVKKTEKSEEEEEKDVTDTTSHETVETVTVTAMVHKDQAPDTPKLNEEPESKNKKSNLTKTDQILQEADKMQKELSKKVEEMETKSNDSPKSMEQISQSEESEEVTHSTSETEKSLKIENEKKDKIQNSPKEEEEEVKKQDEVKQETKIESTKKEIDSHEESKKKEIDSPEESTTESKLEASKNDNQESAKSKKSKTRDESQAKSDRKQGTKEERNEKRKSAKLEKETVSHLPIKTEPNTSSTPILPENNQFEKSRGKEVSSPETSKADKKQSEIKSATTKVKTEEKESKDNQTDNQRFIDESSSSSPRSSKLSIKSRPSTAKSRKSSPKRKKEDKRTTFFNETSEEQNSEDQSAIVAVIESPEWGEDDEDDEEIRNAIGDDDVERDTELEIDDGVGIIRVLPSTSEEETPRNLGIMKRPGTDTLPQVLREPQVRLTRSQSPREVRKEKIRQKQRKDSGGRDSGIEPSPRVSRIPRRNLKCYPNTEKQQSINMETITRDVQISVRRYYLERKIFFQLMELKRLQIRHGKTNEHVLVKRQVDSFNKAGMTGPTLGVVKYEKPFTFRDFESFLYEQLRRLQKRPATSEWCTEAKQCTQKTHRCHHATSAYTSVPIYTYHNNCSMWRRPRTRGESSSED
ncbi:ankycorbin isoform X2 [Leptopilina heterotoma]|uniref:ankycorbin isoform X2 n=1 Tax=Leptopilina heterotoma TaxID=63436 RepID=UPI001CA81F86|nr:ankycorbin isoform X2 [Leptopilina heterotoma]XP_043475375.1 ankycorbin isoform X2 [Leptopilina heterotoma]